MTNYYNTGLRTMLTLQQPSDVWTNGFGYDAAKRLASVTSPAGTFTYSFHQQSTLVNQLSLPNGSTITNAYDSVARQRFTKLLTSSSTLLDSTEYGYNLGNQRVTITNEAGVRWTNRYDGIGQLTNVDSTVNGEDRGYGYDTAWNLAARNRNGTVDTFTVDGKNGLSAAPGFTGTYDGNGNLTNDGTFTYVYDDENRLSSRSKTSPVNGSPAVAFSYDGLGRKRVQADYAYDSGTASYVLTGSTSYIYDGMRVIQERDSWNNPVVAYTRGSDLSGSLEGAGGIGGLLARFSTLNSAPRAATLRPCHGKTHRNHITAGRISSAWGCLPQRCCCCSRNCPLIGATLRGWSIRQTNRFTIGSAGSARIWLGFHF